jgi:hypothetical protein
LIGLPSQWSGVRWQGGVMRVLPGDTIRRIWKQA